MAKGNYNVESPGMPSSRESTWKSFTCTFLILATMCIVLYFAALPLRAHDDEIIKEKASDNVLSENYSSEKVNSTKKDDNRKSDKIIEQIVTEENSHLSHATFHENNKENYDSYTTGSQHSTNQPIIQSTDIENIETSTIDEFKELEEKLNGYLSEKHVSTDTPSSTPPSWKTTLRSASTLSWLPTPRSPTTSTEESHSNNVIHEVHTTEPNNYANTIHNIDVNHSVYYRNESEDNDFTKLNYEQTTNSNYNSITYPLKYTQSYLGTTNGSTTENIVKQNETEYIIDVRYTPTCEPIPEMLCDSGICTTTAIKMLTLLDDTKDPCHDFYGYACGGMRKDFINDNDLKRSVWEMIYNNLMHDNSSDDYLIPFKNYYLSCLNYDSNSLNISKVVEVLHSVAEFDSNQALIRGNEARFSKLTNLLTELMKRNFAAVFDIRINVNNDRKLGIVIQPAVLDSVLETIDGDNIYEKKCFQKSELELGENKLRDVYATHKKCRHNKKLYLRTIRDALSAFNVYGDLDDDYKENNITKIINTVEIIIQTLRQNYQSPNQALLKTSPDASQFLTIEDLENKIPLIKWTDMFNSLFQIELDNTTLVQVYLIEQMEQTINNLNQFGNTRELLNGLLAMYAHSLYRDFQLSQNNICDRKRYCIKASSKFMEDISSSLYLDAIRKRPDLKGKDKITEDIFTKLKTTFKNEVNENLSLKDESHKKVLLEKVESLNLYNIRKYMPWKNKDFLGNRYCNVSMDPHDFVKNTADLEILYRKNIYSSFGNDPMIPEMMWTILSLPYDTEPISIPELGTIVLPLAATMNNKYSSKLPSYFSMADLGFQLAKQINYFIAPGLRKDILKEHPDAQTGAFDINIHETIDGLNYSYLFDLDPETYSDERYTDAAGAILAYKSYMEHQSKTNPDFPVVWVNKTIDQLYFIYMAQQFCTKATLFDDRITLLEKLKLPPMFRVNSVASNTPDFAKAFSCEVDSIMKGDMRRPPAQEETTSVLEHSNTDTFEN